MAVIFVHGPTFSGKTSRLIKGYRLCKRYNLSVYVIKPYDYNKTEQDRVVKAHTGEQLKSEVYILGSGPYPRRKKERRALVEDAHLFSIEELEFIIRTSEERGVRILSLFGWKTDYMGEILPSSEYLLKRADMHEAEFAICDKCGDDPATMNQRMFNGSPAGVGARLELGPGEYYRPRCRRCFVHPLEVENSYLRGTVPPGVL